MRAWPTIDLPKIDISLPDLQVRSTLGESNLSAVARAGEYFSMYVCGITPYDATHLGHAATYVTFDLINRYLTNNGHHVHFVENVTDIDEPLFARADRDNTSWKSLGFSQTALFVDDMTALRVLPPDHFVPVTEVMSGIIEAVDLIRSRGFTYTLEGDIYFDISSFLNRLAELGVDYKDAVTTFAERGGDPQRQGKRSALDPILWIGHRNSEPAWEAPFGSGRPGWHIECVYIALRFLRGENWTKTSSQHAISLQGGGADLIFPHHFMTAAQAEALLNIPFASTYLHSGMIGYQGEKMSKSRGNLVFVSTLRKSGVDPMAIRYALLTGKYSENREWTDGLLETSVQKVSRIRENLSREKTANPQAFVVEIARALADDLNTPRALEAIDDWCSATEKLTTPEHSPGLISRAMDSLLGLAL
jgi:L-cysteine:1D-myo-inositol 2-amino-2-deoxy-alpha-D-glucopyranoside ligase